MFFSFSLLLSPFFTILQNTHSFIYSSLLTICVKPLRYSPFIKGSLPYTKIDKAYKGYTYSINLNSLKQAQSLARRIYELMACNTLVVSNFSRGVQCQMGELTILSDSANEIIRRINKLEAQQNGKDMLRLAALRKVMSESTYQDRLAYIVSKICNLDDFVHIVYHIFL